MTTVKDENGRPTVYSLLPAGRQWLAPVGRLDKASEGLLLLTNDTEWAARITSPQTHVEKTYYVQIGAIAEGLAAEVARRLPKIATVQRSLAKRQKQQVYVDAMQNARGKTIAAAYSARVKPGATVSMPLTWKQIEKGVKISDFTIENLPSLIKKHGGAWKDFFNSRQELKLTS